jgi:hypothetical protein
MSEARSKAVDARLDQEANGDRRPASTGSAANNQEDHGLVASPHFSPGAQGIGIAHELVGLARPDGHARG